VLVIGVVAAAVIDLRSRRIPNELTAGLTGIGIGLAASAHGNLSIGASLAGLALGLIFMMPGYVMGATGAGDVKLMGAVGALVGPSMVLTAFLCTSIAGGALALAVAARRGQMAQTIASTGKLIAAPTGARQEIKAAPALRRFAYGPAIAIGSVLAALVG
jgi:prepilin peptidase CpaA